MSSNKRRWALWGAGLGIFASVSGAALHLDLTPDAHATPEAAAPAPAVPVTVVAVQPRSVTTWQEFSGRLEAVDRVEVRSRVAGAIQSAHFREGALVKAGDLLVKIDPAPFEAAVAQAEGLLASARAKLDLADTELERGRRLVAKNTISDSDFAQRQSLRSEALANLQAAEAALTTARLDLGYTEIRAPISGRVGKLEITAGNLVAAGSVSPALTTLVSSGPIYASFNANEELVARTLAELPGTEAGLAAIDQVPVEIGTLGDEGTPLVGKLQLIDNEVDAQSGTIRVRAVFDNPGNRLIPGQFVRIRLGEPKAEDRLMVSERAVGTDQDKKFVFVVDDGNTVTYRQVQLGASVEGMRIVEKGLSPGDRIIVNGLQRVRAGVVVDPQTEVAAAQ
ncbi:efflux RND transporter periplasmic adaptor subunit [Rhizobium sp. TRM96647]|uniref:efflux RND transporter periplasmic adaptor subunit n=1 Tax=unclassified Rhizobium TaxID=2613769 RepID=UPI0021E7EC24|nr:MULTISPECIES: efflux RND transporter periplasmic adaptor subunit [unclassified Rhizobium]MCV3738810.1 efflux RND transporter periplasmic adaptor subunit [Rhizobium sp. TRM96647]MCV3760483.1 efflux RND transporter periplasmic adaptor subunit [Rhizobium sp. TRM96650]